MFLGFYFDPTGRGVIASIITGAGVVSSLSAYLLYGEKLSLFTILGIVVNTSGLALIAL
jgi:drug/metabolite transporter (DMT)-like permease